jgi:DNA ligase-associated metallophosphoesterase
VTDGDLRIHLGDAPAFATPEGGLWLPLSRTLVVSDLHLEKGSAFATRGALLPPWDTAATLRRLHALVDRLAPATLVALGDSFHDRHAGARVLPDDRRALEALEARTRCVWIEGNHDPEAPAWLAGERRETLRVDGVLLRHLPGEPLEGAACEVAGHLHPCLKVAGASGRRVRRRCFAGDGTRLVMPAFGAYAGGLNVLDAAYAGLWPKGFTAYALGARRVHAIGVDALLPDGGGRATMAARLARAS